MRWILPPASVLFVLVLATTARSQGMGWGGGDLMKALDVDGNGRLSSEETANAARVLAYLDENGDGELDAEELGRRSWDDMGDMDDWGDMDGWGGGSRRGRRGGGETKLLRPEEVDPKNGRATIPDRATFRAMAYRRGMVMENLKGLEFVKFQIEDPETDDPKLYFINTATHPTHIGFMSSIGKPRGPFGMRGALVYRPFLRSPKGEPGLYTFEFELEDTYAFARVKAAFDLIERAAPELRGKLAYHPLPRARSLYAREKEDYSGAKIPIFLEEDRFGDIGFLPLNCAESFGRLRLMRPGERPGAREIVIYEVPPNEMPRVAGVITGTRITPLSHVNLRAIQDKVPNAYLRGAENDAKLKSLLGKYVYYRVAEDGHEIREARLGEVNAHFASFRPAASVTPKRDLDAKKIRRLRDLDFEDAESVGVKAANLAVLHDLGLPEGTVPEGYAVPFYFYDAFMRHNGLYRRVTAMRAEPGFSENTELRVKRLKQLRKLIKKGKMPAGMTEALTRVQAAFPKGASIRCRSSSNNEDLPGFSGAGLYDSCTHHPREGHLAKSIQQVFAGLWTFRAYEEREFHRVDHLAAAMGVLLHRNFEAERANGVAVSEDVLYQTGKRTGRSFYVNAQAGEDLVTNPESDAVPEERLLGARFVRDDVIVRRSNRIPRGQMVLGEGSIHELRLALKAIDRRFRKLYRVPADDRFAMEIEFKVSANGRLVIKQARPWVFGG